MRATGRIRAGMRAGLGRGFLALGLGALALVTAAAPAQAQRPDPAYRLPGLVGPENPAPPAGLGARATKPDPRVKEAQAILTSFGIPAGSVDGLFGPETGRGLCAFRRIAGLPVSRGPLDTKTLTALRTYDRTYPTLRDIPAREYLGKSTYLLAHQTCQVLFYVEGSHYRRVFATSTGMSGHRTPNGSYSLGPTQKGWYCSTLYPDGCTYHTEGWFASISNYGNMYNPRQVVGDIFLHGSMSVPPYPASHGCIRVRVIDADWLYKYVGVGVRTPVFVTGTSF